MSNRMLFASALETGTPDPRQRQFRSVMAAMNAESDQPIKVIAMEGFRASRVDLGWLSEEILDYVLTIPDCDPERRTSAPLMTIAEIDLADDAKARRRTPRHSRDLWG